jgi:chitin disaccharide deacetylase
VTSCSLMVDAPAARNAAAIARAVDGLAVGLHFVQPAGCDLDCPPCAHAALTRQLTRFRALIGRGPSHLDSHHHVHRKRDRFPVFADAARALGVPIRHGGEVAYVGGFYGQWEPRITDLQHLSRDYLLELIETEATGPATELACHPAADVTGLTTSYDIERVHELATLTSPGLRDAIHSLGVELVSFAELERWRRSASTMA